MNEALICRAAQVVTPNGPDGPFPGTFDEAIDTMVAYAYGIGQYDGDHARRRLTEVLQHSDPDRVAEVCAGALLRLADNSTT